MRENEDDITPGHPAAQSLSTARGGVQVLLWGRDLCQLLQWRGVSRPVRWRGVSLLLLLLQGPRHPQHGGQVSPLLPPSQLTHLVFRSVAFCGNSNILNVLCPNFPFCGIDRKLGWREENYKSLFDIFWILWNCDKYNDNWKINSSPENHFSEFMWISTSASSALSVWALYLKFFAFQVEISFSPLSVRLATLRQTYIGLRSPQPSLQSERTFFTRQRIANNLQIAVRWICSVSIWLN